MSKQKQSTLKSPDASSKRSARRSRRRWVNLETSSRMHRRAARRSNESREISNTIYDAGVKKETSLSRGGKLKASTHTAGGSMRYHAT
jgi:hypothetical protein